MKTRLENFKDRISSLWRGLTKRADDEEASGITQEKVVVFVISLILALCMWMLVNLNRDFNLNIDLPIMLGNIPDNSALAEDLPDYTTVSIQAEGWKLINMYNNPPRIYVDVTEGEINLFDQVQQQMNAIPEINVQKVEPLMLNVKLEERINKTVPVVTVLDVQFEENFDFLGEPELDPDSVTLSGAVSIVDDIEYWETDSTSITNVRNDFTTTLPLREPPNLVNIDRQEVEFSGRVAEFTEGESRVDVQLRNLPAGRDITLSPQRVTIRYKVPIDEFSDVADSEPFEAYIDYTDLEADQSGFLEPVVETTTDEFNIRIRLVEPERVSYFNVVDSG